MSNNLSEMYVFIITGILLFTVLCVFIVFFVTSYYKKQQENQKEKQRLQSQFNEDLLNSTIEIQEKAFDDISRELHDNVGQQLSAATIYLNLLLQDTAFNNNDKLQACRELISNSLQDIRHISQSLLGEKVTRAGIVASLKLEITRINKLGIAKANLEATDEPFNLNPKKEIILFRIIQEAIGNATKHAPGSIVTITIQKESDQLLISVKDNGKGFDPQKISEPGIGLLNMQNRAKTIGATFSLNSELNTGTRIDISVNTEAGV